MNSINAVVNGGLDSAGGEGHSGAGNGSGQDPVTRRWNPNWYPGLGERALGTAGFSAPASSPVIVLRPPASNSTLPPPPNLVVLAPAPAPAVVAPEPVVEAQSSPVREPGLVPESLPPAAGATSTMGAARSSGLRDYLR